MKYLPLNNYVLVEVDEESEKTEHDLIVPTVKGQKTEAYAIRAIIRKMGPLAHKVKVNDEIEVVKFKEGDRVLVAKWEGQNVAGNGKNYILIKPEHVMALVKLK